uniref:Putative glycogen debranching enzyme-like protein n=1 Tax=uncultured bacterium RM57 TaxID=561246 RepID=C8XT89_9BACT|nr:putative glycogen debranching enzyme-like protein [uncultured bacterium RM57]
MYVHVDITFAYLRTVARYVQSSGDMEFLRAHWSNVQAAYRYCVSLIDPATGLPTIPSDKEGANEQERMRDDLGLSSSWVAAAEGFAQMAETMRSPEAASATRAAEAAEAAMASSSWDASRHFWIGGHLSNGQALDEQRPHPLAVLAQHVFSDAQIQEILDHIASPDFQSDWGTRTLSASSQHFDPDSYGAGSVSALGSADVAASFWQYHRPLTAWQIWHRLLPWNTLDSEGHIHEVLAGDFYHPEKESVPEQTWSSAGYLSAAVQGMLGLSVHVSEHGVTFAPHLPAEWGQISVRHVRVGASTLRLRLSRDLQGITLEAVNEGDPVAFTFSPEIPLGASLKGASLAKDAGSATEVPARVDMHSQDEHATVVFQASTGATRCHITYEGGLQIEAPASRPAIGAGSRDMELSSVSLAGRTLTIEAFVNSQGPSALDLHTVWQPSRIEGGRGGHYTQRRIVIRF